MNNWLRGFVGAALLFNHFASAQQSIADGIDKFKNKKYSEAYEILSMADHSRNPVALYYLGVMLDKGLGTTSDKDSATKALLESSNMGNLSSRIYLAESGASVFGSTKLDQLVNEKASLKEKMKNKGMKFYSWNDEPKYPDYWDKNKALYEQYSEIESKINDWAESNALEATYAANNMWKVGDTILYLAIDKKANPDHSWDSDWHTKYLVEGSWSYFIPHSSKSQDGSFSLSFHSKRNYENSCDFFKEIESDNIINYERLFKECYVKLFSKTENSESKLIGSVAFKDFEAAGEAYQNFARSIDTIGKREVIFLKLFIGLSILVVGFFILKKVISITKKATNQATEKLKNNISNAQDNIKESRLKRKFEDTVVEETVKQQIKENTRVEEEIDKAIINEVVKREVEGNSSIDLTKLKQDIAVALKDGQYDKVKELTDLAEKIDKLK